MADRASCRERIMRVLENSSVPMDVENVRLRAGMKNWESTKSILLEMALLRSVSAKKTSRSWVFWVNDTSPDEGGEPE